MRRNAKDIIDGFLTSLNGTTLLWLAAGAVGGMLVLRYFDRQRAASAPAVAPTVAAPTAPAAIPMAPPPPPAPAIPPPDAGVSF